MKHASMNKKVILEAKGLTKTYGHVTALNKADIKLYKGEILAIIGDNGAGKSTLIKALSGALVPDSGVIFLDGKKVHFKNPSQARARGIETVYQDLAVAPALNIADNLFLGREILRPNFLGKIFRLRHTAAMLHQAKQHMEELKIGIQSMRQEVSTLSGGQRQAVAVCRSAAFARHLIIMDEPTAALGVKESSLVLELIRKIKSRGLSIIVISHNMPQVFAIADRIHIQRLGQREAVINPKHYSMSDAVAIMTGSKKAHTQAA